MGVIRLLHVTSVATDGKYIGWRHGMWQEENDQLEPPTRGPKTLTKSGVDKGDEDR